MFFPRAHCSRLIPAALVACLLMILAAMAPQTSQAGQLPPETLIPIQIPAGTNLIHLTRDFCHDPAVWRELAQKNKLANPDLIIHETTLQIPLSYLIAEKLSAKVATVSGPVSRRNGEGADEPLRKDDLLLPGQTVVTGADGYTHLILPDNTYTRIEPDSRFTINYLIRLADGSIKADFSLNKGDIIHWMQQKLRPNDTFRTRTPIAVTGIRGTEYRLKTTGANANTVETLHGLVEVASAGKTIALPAETGSRIRQGQPPQAPRALPEPPSGQNIAAIYRTLPILIDPPPHDQAQSFRLRVTADHLGQETLWDKTVNKGGRFTIANLLDGSYFAFLTVFDTERFESKPTGPLPFTVRTVPPAPVITAPQNKGTVFGKRAKIEWLESDQAHHYQVQLAADPEFNTILEEKPVQEARYTTPELKPGSYHFRVQTVTADDFATLYSIPLAWKQMDEPAMGGMEATANTKPVLQWPVMAEGWTYDLQVAQDEEFQSLIVDVKGLPATSYTLAEKLDPGKYYIRLRGLENGQPVSAWTPAQTMTVKRKPLGWEEVLIGAAIIGILIL